MSVRIRVASVGIMYGTCNLCKTYYFSKSFVLIVTFYYIPPKVSIPISVVAVAFFISVVMILSYDSNKIIFIYEILQT